MHTMFEFLLKGGWVMWPIFGFSVVSLSIAVDRAWSIFSSTWGHKTLEERLMKIDTKQELTRFCESLAQRDDPLSRALCTFCRYAPDNIWQHKVSHVSSQAIERLEHRLNWFPVIANVSTLTGLFGTVLGMVKVFQTIEVQGGTPNPGQLAGGIWEALLTTLAGLAVAIPTILIYNLLRRRVDRLTRRIKESVEILRDLHDRNKVDAA